jgi:hypothetical protein
MTITIIGPVSRVLRADVYSPAVASVARINARKTIGHLAIVMIPLCLPAQVFGCRSGTL